VFNNTEAMLMSKTGPLYNLRCQQTFAGVYFNNS